MIPEALSYPSVTDSLAARILRVSESVAHAHENQSLPHADLLIKWDKTYNDHIKEELKRNKPISHDQASLRAYNAREAVLNTKPQTIDECKGQLTEQFSLFSGCSGARLFAERSRLADLYDHVAVKAGLTPHP